MSEKNTPRTVIGPDTVVNGEIHSKQDLVVQGRVEGTLQVDAVLFIETDGVVEADVTANHAVVAGTFQGDLKAMDALEVAQTGRILGRVNSPRILVSDGAILNADIRMSGGDAGAADVNEEADVPRSETSTRRSSYSYTRPAKETTPSVVEDEGEDEVDEPEVVEVSKAPAPRVSKAKKGGKKKKS